MNDSDRILGVTLTRFWEPMTDRILGITLVEYDSILRFRKNMSKCMTSLAARGSQDFSTTNCVNSKVKSVRVLVVCVVYFCLPFL